MIVHNILYASHSFNTINDIELPFINYLIQCCYGGEVRKSILLRHLYEELEICFKSLIGYLDKKRHIFPRFYFISDAVLLAVLSRPKDLDSVRPHLKWVAMYF